MENLSWVCQIIVFFILQEIRKTNWNEDTYEKKNECQNKKFFYLCEVFFWYQVKEKKENKTMLGKMGERYFEIGNFPIKIFL